jgi:hypothetical protein
VAFALVLAQVASIALAPPTFWLDVPETVYRVLQLCTALQALATLIAVIGGFIELLAISRQRSSPRGRRRAVVAMAGGWVSLLHFAAGFVMQAWLRAGHHLF